MFFFVGETNVPGIMILSAGDCGPSGGASASLGGWLAAAASFAEATLDSAVIFRFEAPAKVILW